ncbi:hypothetical protein MNBD_GAMMA09-2492 [hydrothermal vent metagenome]|uniref:Uncharacterized protein n=1 Tax=hydrothermal vent metagenome TaxID=652676 RepID=A0A3B0Y086_9ZZZZ
MKFDPVQSKYLISVHKPLMWVASGVFTLLVILFIIWNAFEYGRHVAGFDQGEYDQEIEILRQSLDEQTVKKESALRDNVRLSRGSDIQKDASSQISDSLSACEEATLKMKEELTFYHNIVTPRKSKREIQVNKVVMTRSGDGRFHYKVVLIQVGRHDSVQRGVIELSFQGRNSDGKEVRLDLPTVSLKKTGKRQKFGFKYFQNFEGGIKFPEGFEPLSMFVKAQPKSAKVPRVERVYAWGSLIAGGNEANVGQENNKIN